MRRLKDQASEMLGVYSLTLYFFYRIIDKNNGHYTTIECLRKTSGCPFILSLISRRDLSSTQYVLNKWFSQYLMFRNVESQQITLDTFNLFWISTQINQLLLIAFDYSYCIDGLLSFLGVLDCIQEVSLIVLLGEMSIRLRLHGILPKDLYLLRDF